MRKFTFLAVLQFLLFLTPFSPALAYKIKSCDWQAEKNLQPAAEFIRKNMNDITKKYGYLSTQQKQEIVRKWTKLKIKCKDSASMCRKNFVGFAHGGPGNTINICHDEMVDRGYKTCDAVGTIMHEVGHAHGFRKVPGHNDPNSFIRKSDIMYRMGDDAEKLCEDRAAKGKVNNAKLAGKVRTALGGKCSSNKDCTTGKCADKPFKARPPGVDIGICVCNDDDDCPGKQNCYKPLLSQNYCSGTNNKIGAACKKNSQCASNKCKKDVCVAKK